MKPWQERIAITRIGFRIYNLYLDVYIFRNLLLIKKKINTWMKETT